MRKVLSRAESQALTRESLLDAGEELLLEGGYHATSLAAIANAAGRTIGAVYSNYASKEELCLEILKRKSSDEIIGLMGDLTESDDDLQARLDVVATRWAQLSSDPRQLLLAAEYALTAMRQPELRTRLIEAAERTIASIRIVIEDYLPPEGQGAAEQTLDRAVHAIVATGVGLSALQAIDQISPAHSADILVEVIRTWLDKAIEEARLTA